MTLVGERLDVLDHEHLEFIRVHRCQSVIGMKPEEARKALGRREHDSDRRPAVSTTCFEYEHTLRTQQSAATVSSGVV
jgi:hypothetical protein